MNELGRLLAPALGYIDLGMFGEAWEELENLPPEMRANFAVLELRISIYQSMGKWESARMLAESLARQFPENPQWWIEWAYSLRREKSVAEARAVLLEAAARHPDVAMIPYNLACYSCVEGDVATATPLLKRAIEMQPDLKATALDDPDLDLIFGGHAPAFDPPQAP